ncbi:hypothetical protein LUZ63_002105 [Rhynchospora breviuscula]|uniref:C2 domain-containing protein n=1 Tax=Rhynchospora breviuscula TaxID=2022672 RepID=A0A9Q0HXQ7_9POAL|nr:hypothetical protein LUZ63_002105 [Rhynchospora breviuscula]
MRGGALEVLLVRAEGLKRAHLLGSSGHYVIIQCGNQTIKSKITTEIDERVWWNEKFRFVLPQLEFQEMPKLIARTMKQTKFSEDYSIGETIIHLSEILMEGCEKGFVEIKPAAYNIVLEDGTYQGEMKLGIRYIPNVELKEQRNICSKNYCEQKKQSICRDLLSIALKRIPWSKLFFFQKCSAYEESKKSE